VITPEHVDLNLPTVKIDHTKLEHLNADQKDALLTVALHMGVISDPTVDNATISPVLSNIVQNGSMTL